MDRRTGVPSQRLRVVAVGDRGLRLIEAFAEDDLFAGDGADIHTIAVGTDAESLEVSSIARRVHVSRPKPGRPGSLRDELRWRDDLERELFRADLTLLVVDAVDSEALDIASVACRIGRDRGGVALAFVPAPEGWESGNTLDLGLSAVVESADSTFVVPCAPSAASLVNADALVRQAIRALIEISARPGLVSHSLDSVRETFHHAGLGEVSAGRGQGEDRFLDAARDALESPSLFRTLRDAARVALHVRAPASSTLFDFSDLSTAVGLACSAGANVWTAIYLDSPDDSVEVTLLAAGLPRP